MQTLVPDEYRGRMGALDMLIWGMMPLGTLPIGAIASVAGAPLAVSLVAGLGLLLLVVAGVLLPSLRKLTF